MRVTVTMHDPHSKKAAWREKSDAGHDIRPSLAVGAHEDEVRLSGADRRATAAESMSL